MTIPVDVLQQLQDISIIEMFQIDLVSGLHYQSGDTTATTLYRFHNGTNGINTNLMWQSNVYTATACKAEGFETGENSVMARPTLTFANTGGAFSTILALVNSVYKKLEDKTEKDILDSNMPINYFINKSFSRLGNQINKNT